MRPYLGVLPRVFRALAQQRSSPQPPAHCAACMTARLQDIWSLQKWAHSIEMPNAKRGYQTSQACTYDVLLLGQGGCTADLKRAFSAPKICTVLAGYFARLTRDPAANTIPM